VPEGINVAVFEPGFMPGTGLSRQHSPGVQRMGQGMQRLPLPGIASPVKSGPALASVTLDQRWAHLRDGDFVVIDKERDVMPIANDPDRERRLWDATRELLNQALSVMRLRVLIVLSNWTSAGRIAETVEKTNENLRAPFGS